MGQSSVVLDPGLAIRGQSRGPDYLFRSLRLTLAETITQSIRGNDKKDSEGCLSVFVSSVARVFSIEAIRPQFVKCCFQVIDFKETALLRRVTTVLGEPDLYLISA